jgi:uncharacterized protein involved in outer membrane biogenesis
MNVRRILVGLLGAAGVLLIVLALLLWFVHASLDSIVQTALETHGSRLTGTRVVVEDVDISPQSGEGTLRGLRIENPSGFSRGDAIRFGEVRLRIDASTLMKDPLVIDEVRIEAPYANYEVKPPGKANIDVIRENLERAIPKGAKQAPPAGEAAPAPEASAHRLVIRKFSFENGSVSADARALGGKQFDTTLPPLRLSNLGGEQGTPADEVGQTVLVAFTRGVARSVAAKGLGKLLEEKLGGTGEAAKGLLDRLAE